MQYPFDPKYFGLTERDLAVYEALLSKQASGIRAVGLLVGINYGTTYDIIKNLQSMKLVCVEAKAGKQSYSAASTNTLRNYFNNYCLQTHSLLEQTNGYINDLSVATTKSLTVTEILQDILDNAQTDVLVYSAAAIRSHLVAELKAFNRRRANREISVKDLSMGTPGRKLRLVERRQLLVAPEMVPSAQMYLYGSKIAQFSLSDSGQTHVEVIDNKELAKLQRLMFMNQWKRAWPLDSRQL